MCAGGGHPQRLPDAPAGRQQDCPQRRPAPAQVTGSLQCNLLKTQCLFNGAEFPPKTKSILYDAGTAM